MIGNVRGQCSWLRSTGCLQHIIMIIPISQSRKFVSSRLPSFDNCCTFPMFLKSFAVNVFGVWNESS
jgi:hypothetical protein